jgi:hypothetical protein
MENGERESRRRHTRAGAVRRAGARGAGTRTGLPRRGPHTGGAGEDAPRGRTQGWRQGRVAPMGRHRGAPRGGRTGMSSGRAAQGRPRTGEAASGRGAARGTGRGHREQATAPGSRGATRKKGWKRGGAYHEHDENCSSPVIQARARREWERGGRGREVVSPLLDHGCAGEGCGWARMGGGGGGWAAPRQGPRRDRAGGASLLL